MPLRLNATSTLPGEAWLGFGATKSCTLNLSTGKDLKEAARNLFVMLHLLDNPHHYTGIAVSPIPHHGLGIAINDRLERAAADRS